jgi:hypothetical protein
LAGQGLGLGCGPFALRVHSSLPQVGRQLALLYSDYPLAAEAGFADFHVTVGPVVGARRWLRPQIQFDLDGHFPFKPLPRDQAFAMLEWGLNWCVSNYAHRFLILHAAVLEQGGRAVLLPAPPGSGKSTLTAALCLRGWRLFSDELALIDTATGLVWPMTRPVSLKNQSIDVIQAFEPAAVIARHPQGDGCPSQAARRQCQPHGDAGPAGLGHLPPVAGGQHHQADPLEQGTRLFATGGTGLQLQPTWHRGLSYPDSYAGWLRLPRVPVQ